MGPNESEGEEGQSRPTLPRIAPGRVPQTRCGVIFSSERPLVLTLEAHVLAGNGHVTRAAINDRELTRRERKRKTC
jgi:hypothetical protein